MNTNVWVWFVLVMLSISALLNIAGDTMHKVNQEVINAAQQELNGAQVVLNQAQKDLNVEQVNFNKSVVGTIDSWRSY